MNWENGNQRGRSFPSHPASNGWLDPRMYVLTPASVASTKPLVFFLAVKLRVLVRSQKTQGSQSFRDRQDREKLSLPHPSGACPPAQEPGNQEMSPHPGSASGNHGYSCLLIGRGLERLRATPRFLDVVSEAGTGARGQAEGHQLPWKPFTSPSPPNRSSGHLAPPQKSFWSSELKINLQAHNQMLHGEKINNSACRTASSQSTLSLSQGFNF